MKLQSDFALLDVKRGRHKLLQEVLAGHRRPVTITGYLVAPLSADDGTSREFQVDVTEVVTGDKEVVR